MFIAQNHLKHTSPVEATYSFLHHTCRSSGALLYFASDPTNNFAPTELNLAKSRSPAKQYWLPSLPRHSPGSPQRVLAEGTDPRPSKDAATRTSTTVNARR